MDEQIKIKKVDIFKDSSYQDRTKINLALEDRFELKNVSDKQIIKKEHQENLNSKYQLVNQDRVVEICQYNNEQTALSDKDHKNLRKERESKIKKDDKEFLEAQREEIERSLGTNVKYDSTIIEKFTRDYVGNNYKSARNEIETILKLAQLYENGQTLYMTNKEGMQVPINYDFIEFAECCRNAFFSALEANGLRYSEDEKKNFDVIKVSEQKNALNKNSSDIESIQKIFQQSEYDKEVKTVDSLLINAIIKLETDFTDDEYEALLERNMVDSPLSIIDILKTGNKANYTANKELIDRLYIEAGQIFTSLVKEFFSIEYLKEHKDRLGTNYDLNGLIDKRIQKIYKNIQKINVELDNLTDIMQMKLIGEELGDEQKEFLVSKYLMNDERFEVDMKVLCDKYSENSYDTSQITDVKNELQSLCSQLNGNLSRLELVGMHEKICALAKVVTTDTTIFITPIEKLQVKKLLSYANKSRAAVLLTGCKRRCIELADLTVGEQAYIKRTMNQEGDSEQLIIAYANELYNKAELNYYEEEKAFMDNDDNFLNISQILNKKLEPLETAHPETTAKYLETITIKSRKIKMVNEEFLPESTDERQEAFFQKLREQEVEVVENKAESSRYALLKEMIDAFKKQMQAVKDVLEKMKIQKQIDALTKEISFLEIKKKLHDEHYSMYGTNENKGDYLFRSMSGFDNVYTYSKIPEAELYQMMKKLSAGAYEEEETDADKRVFYQCQNMEGVEMYKGYMMKHLVWMYEKYGTKYPDAEYIYQNYAEINRDGGTLQPDSALLRQPDVINVNNPRDVLLETMCDFYHSMVTIIRLSYTFKSMNDSSADYHTIVKKFWQKNEMDRKAAYINAHVALGGIDEL